MILLGEPYNNDEHISGLVLGSPLRFPTWLSGDSFRKLGPQEACSKLGNIHKRGLILWKLPSLSTLRNAGYRLRDGNMGLAGIAHRCALGSILISA